MNWSRVVLFFNNIFFFTLGYLGPYTIIGDSFFGSISLIEELKKRCRKSIFTTIHPKWLFQNGIHNLLIKKWTPGQYNWSRRDDGIIAVSWNDSRMVNFLSYGFPPNCSFLHSKRKRGQAARIPCQIPFVAHIYRLHYHNVDNYDKNVQNWRICNRTFKWTVAMYWSLLKFIIINSWIIYKMVKNSNITQKEFIRSLYLNIVPLKLSRKFFMA